LSIVIAILDTIAILTAFAAAVFWWKASGRSVRRLTRTEELDAADINRLVVAINRSQLLNRRAAIAAAISAFAAATHMLVGAVTR
jgi:hypothetical protein